MKRIAALSVLLLGAAVAGPRQNSVIVGSSQEPTNVLDYWSTANQVISAEVNGYLGFNNLLQKNDAGQLVADLATRVPTVANGDIKITRQGGKVVSNSVTYRIRPGATWSDGTPITTRDFQFWLEVQNDDRVPVPTRDPWTRATLTRISDQAFTVTFGQGGYVFAGQGTGNNSDIGYAPAHVMQADWNAFKSDTAKLDPKTQGEQINQRWNQFLSKYTSANGLPKVSSGPFRVTAWRPGSSLTMARNPRYWLKPAGGEGKYAQQIIYRFFSDDNTLRVNVLSGQVDALSTTGVTFDQALELQKTERGRYKTYFVPGSVWEHISLNVFPSVQKVGDLDLDDKRVRQALLYAMNRDQLVQQLYQGKQPVSNTFVNPLSPLYKATVQKYPYNPAKARQLFAAAGWQPGSDGILTKGGKKFTLNFTTTSGNRIRERVQQVLIAQLKAVGVDARVANQPSSVVFDDAFIQRAAEGKWDMFMFAWTQDPALEDGNLFTAQLATGEANIPTQANGFAGQNIEGWNNARFTALYKQASGEFDLAKRKQLFSQMQDIYADELPALPLYNRANPVTVATGLANYTFSASSLYPSWQAYQIGWTQNGAQTINKQRE